MCAWNRSTIVKAKSFEGEEKNKYGNFFTGLGSVSIVKNYDLGHSFLLYGLPSWQIKYIYLTLGSVGSSQPISQPRGFIFKHSTSKSNWNLEVLDFVERGQPEKVEKNPWSRERTSNKLSPRETTSTGIKPGSQRWEASAYPLHQSCSPWGSYCVYGSIPQCSLFSRSHIFLLGKHYIVCKLSIEDSSLI